MRELSALAESERYGACDDAEQDSTAVPKFAFRSFCPCGNLVGECLPQTLLCALSGEKGGHRPCERNTIRPTAVMW